MIWHALAALALTHGRRLSWRDLERHSADVPEKLLPEIAILSLRAHGIPAHVKQFKFLNDLKIFFKESIALRVKSGEWIILKSFDESTAKIEIITADEINKNTNIR